MSGYRIPHRHHATIQLDHGLAKRLHVIGTAAGSLAHHGEDFPGAFLHLFLASFADHRENAFLALIECELDQFAAVVNDIDHEGPTGRPVEVFQHKTCIRWLAIFIEPLLIQAVDAMILNTASGRPSSTLSRNAKGSLQA